MQIADKIKGLYGIVSPSVGEDPLPLVHAYVDGGCSVLQLRCKDWPEAEVLRSARLIRLILKRREVLFILNDSVEMAIRVGVDGVHLGQTDGDLLEARRRLGPGRVLGVSTHRSEHIARALPMADYVAFGPVWPTQNLSREKAVQGVTALKEVAGVLDGRRPLVAIGGVTVDRVPVLKEAGADAWAVISAISEAPDVDEAVRAFVRA